MTPPTARSVLFAKTALLAAGLCLSAAGCVEPKEAPIVAARRTIRNLQRENAALAQKQRQLQQCIDQLRNQLASLQGFGADRMAGLFTVERVELGRYTAGVNLDKEPGDDGVRVYLQPLDRGGDVVKAAGSICIQLFDLAKPADNLIGQCRVPAEQAGKHWFGGLGRSHYRLDVRWATPPATPDVTVRATFTDLLTGRTFTAQKACKVTLAPAK